TFALEYSNPNLNKNHGGMYFDNQNRDPSSYQYLNASQPISSSDKHRFLRYGGWMWWWYHHPTRPTHLWSTWTNASQDLYSHLNGETLNATRISAWSSTKY